MLFLRVYCGNPNMASGTGEDVHLTRVGVPIFTGTIVDSSNANRGT